VSGRTLRVATWNVRGMRGGTRAVAAAVREQDADVLLLQESGSRRRLRELGERLGWIVCADPRAFPRRRVQNAVLLRTAIAASIRSRLVRFRGGSFVYPRGVLEAEIDESCTAMSVHLGLSGKERGRHTEELGARVEGSSGSILLGGDLNALPADPGPTRLSRLATDCWAAVGEGPGATFPSHTPTARIDYLFAGPAVRPLRAWTAGGTVSDHLMVIADLRLDG
jgi:endonuclease/exonuclease/phosphatase family metal-dependent hydrolase